MRVTRLALLAVTLLGVSVTAQQGAPGAEGQTAQPRFRGGANLVRVDTYVTADGQPVKDLTLDDFEVLEDNVPQRLESFQLVVPRPPAPDAVREPNTVSEAREMARDPEARLFVLFMDIWHVQLEGSHRAQAPLTRLFDRVIGRDDLVGVMHPEMAARSMAFGRRMETVAGILKDNWFWGERGQVVTSDPREREIQQCYPDVDATVGIAHEMIRRRRETRTLQALEDLIRHLEGVREERKFVFVLTEGWLLRGQDQSLARTLYSRDGSRTGPPPPARVGIDPQGRLRMDPRDQDSNFGSCERERSMLAYTDHRAQFDLLIQRANRANVSFYPIDFRGLVGFDEPINSSRAVTTLGPAAAPSADAERLTARHEGLRVLAVNSDGHAIVNNSHFDRDLQRIVDDTGAYYLLGYYSTNTKLDGKYRRLTVRVKRSGVDVRARPGYLAPTEAELASSRVDALMNGAAPGHTTIPPTIARAFAGLGPGRGVVPLRVQTAAAPSQIWITGEIDATLAKDEEWQQGGRVRALFEHGAGARTPVQAEGVLQPGQRTFVLTAPPGLDFVPGRYVVRVELLPKDGSVPLQTTTDAFVPEREWLVSASGLTTRRGPSTGLSYVPTADARFRRTERIRLAVPRSATTAKASARLLGRDGQPLDLPITLTERTDADVGRMLVIDLTLAPLAQGDYAVEITVEQGDRKESATYAFRVIP
jgi:VWFA-related protein